MLLPVPVTPVGPLVSAVSFVLKMLIHIQSLLWIKAVFSFWLFDKTIYSALVTLATLLCQPRTHRSLWGTVSLGLRARLAEGPGQTWSDVRMRKRKVS